jgi:hypothetical protein
MAFFLVSVGFFFSGHLQAAEALKSASIELDNQAKALQNKSPEENERAIKHIKKPRFSNVSYWKKAIKHL